MSERQSFSGRRRYESESARGIDERALEGLVQLGSLLASMLSPREVASQVAEYGCLISGLGAFLVYLTADEGGTLEAVGVEGLAGELSAAPLRLLDVAVLDLERTAPAVVPLAALGSRTFTALCSAEGYQRAWLAPLVIDGVKQAGLMIGLDKRSAPPQRQELRLFRLLSLQAMGALSNSLRYEAEREAQRELLEAERRIALRLQEQFIHPLPAIDGLELAVVSETAYAPELIGGDFHDVVVLPDGQLVALIGDVMGKGIGAAGLTETVRSAVRALSLVSVSPEYILRQANRLLMREPQEEFVSALALTLDVMTGRGFLASAGHPAPILVSNGTAEAIELHHGPLLGTFELPFVATEFQLKRGDALVLYTDGVTEARVGSELFGEDRLIQTLADVTEGDARSLVERVRDEVVSYAGELRDDLHILALLRR